MFTFQFVFCSLCLIFTFFANKAILGKEKYIFQYINLHKNIYEMEIVTTMKMIEVAYEIYKSNWLNDIEEEEVIEE